MLLGKPIRRQGSLKGFPVCGEGGWALSKMLTVTLTVVGFSCICLLTQDALLQMIEPVLGSHSCQCSQVQSSMRLSHTGLRPPISPDASQRGSKDSAHSRQHCILHRLCFVREVCCRLDKADFSPTDIQPHVRWELEQHKRKIGGGSQRVRLTCSVSHNL